MAQHGTYYDPNFGLLLHNYIENKDKFLGIGNFNAQGFEYMEKGIPIGLDTFKRAMTRKIKIIFGTDVGAGGLEEILRNSSIAFATADRRLWRPSSRPLPEQRSPSACRIRSEFSHPAWKPTSLLWTAIPLTTLPPSGASSLS